MAKVVKKSFVLWDDEAILTAFVAGDPLPAWAEERVTNLALIQDPEPEPDPEPGDGPDDDENGDETVEEPEPGDEDPEDPAGPENGAQAASVTESGFDPSAHTVNQVKEYLSGATYSEMQQVFEAEKAGKNRSSIMDIADDDLLG